MKKISFSLFLLSLLLVVLLVSCSKTQVYRDDISCQTLCKAVCDKAEVSGGYSEYDNDHVAFLFGEDSLYEDCSIMYSTEVTDINELGFFHCENKDNAKEFAEIVSKYITEMQNDQKAFIESYAPSQVPKLRNAEVRQYGNYVIYLVMSADDKEDAIEEIEKMLEK